MSYSFKDYVDYVVDPSNRLTIEEFNKLEKLYASDKGPVTMYDLIYIDSSGYKRIDSSIHNKYTPNMNRIVYNSLENYIEIAQYRNTYTVLIRFELSNLVLDDEKSLLLDIDNNILYTNLDDFPKINILEIDEEMDLYLTLKYLNN